MNVFETRTRAVLLGAGIAAAVTLGISSRAADDTKPKTQNVKFQLDPSALNGAKESKARLGYMPTPITLTDVKPAGIKKEPKYLGKPRVRYDPPWRTWAAIHLLYLAFDEPSSGDWKIYVDKNRNGDLTDDGDGAWAKKGGSADRTVYGVKTTTFLRAASWGTSTYERGHGDYGIGIYRIGTASLANTALMYRQGARVGTVKVDGKAHKAILVENDSDAMYSKPVETDADGKPKGKIEGRPVWLVVDMNDDGTLGGKDDVTVDVRAPFKLGQTVYEAAIGKDGYRIALTPTTKAVAVLTPPRAPQKPLLAVGATVPDFRAEGWGGAPVHPADYKGKILILDFWATWCGPCQKSMPHIERVYNAVKDKNVAVLAVCVWDDKAPYTKWVPANQSKYTYSFAFDPAGTDGPNSIATKIFNVNGIPTTYIIGPDGKVADAIVGYEDGDTRVEDALKKLGVSISAATTK